MDLNRKTEPKTQVSAHIYASLLASLRAGKWGRGEKMPSERQLAEEFSCSRVAVRSALGHLAAQKLIQRVHGAGTFVCGGSWTHKRRQIGLVIHESIAEPVIAFYANQIFIGFIRSCDKYGFSSSLIMLKDQESLTEAILRLDLELTGFDAIVLTEPLTPETQKLLEANHCCCVALMQGRGTQVSYVDINNFYGGYIAAKHLLESGRRRTVFIAEAKHDPYVQARSDGIAKAFGEFQLEYELERDFYSGINDEKKSGALIKRLLDEKVPFDSLIVSGDWTTVGVIGELRKRGIRIPEDVALVMYDDYEWVQRVMNLELTAVRQPFEEQISLAVRMAAEKLDGCDGQTRVHVITPELIVRKSSITSGLPTP